MLVSGPQSASLEIDKLEENYWREFNDFQLQLRVHVDERDTTLSKVSPPVSWSASHHFQYDL